MNGPAADEEYLRILLSPLYACASYRPAFGGEAEDGVSLDHFKRLYGADPLYSWVGLDSELMYAAHKAAGGMTSIYRQLGIGCERLLRAIVQDTLKLSEEEAKWSYEYEKEDGKSGVHTLDIRVDVNHLKDAQAKVRLSNWLAASAKALRLSPSRALSGVVMEVRQGYKSADSKRQNADLRFGMRAANEGYLPSIVIVSSQVSEPVRRRYLAAQMLVLVGKSGDATQSTFTFFRDAIGYDLVRFFEANSARLRAEVTVILKGLLSP